MTGERVLYLHQRLPQDQAQQTIDEFFCQEPMFWDYSPKERARQAAQLGRAAQQERHGRSARSEQRAAAQQEEQLRRIQQTEEHQLGSIARQDPHGG